MEHYLLQIQKASKSVSKRQWPPPPEHCRLTIPSIYSDGLANYLCALAATAISSLSMEWRGDLGHTLSPRTATDLV